MKRLGEIRREKYIKNNVRKYGNLNKGFTEAELKHFFKCSKNLKAHLAFQLMANLGLRVGEVVKIKIDDINFFKNNIKIATEKSQTIDFLHLHKQVRLLLHLWVQKYPDEIMKNDGFILFTNEQKRSYRDSRHISPHWLRREFRDTCYLTGLNESYGTSEETYQGKRKRKLYRLTTHLLRHYFITRVYNSSKNPLFTQKLGRHRNFKSTQTYINVNQDEIDSTIKKAFENEGIEVDNGEMEEFTAFYKMWRGMKGK
jgi:integrase